MAAIKLDLNLSVKPEARFEGDASAAGPSGYRFSGKLVARAPLSKPGSTFVVRLGHGGNTGAYSYLEYILKGVGDNTFSVEGKGERKTDEKVDFRLGFKEGSTGQFIDEDKSTYTLGTLTEDFKLDPEMGEDDNVKTVRQENYVTYESTENLKRTE